MKILSVAPSRVSLFGGGTDVNPYAELYGGAVINLAINLRQYVTLYTDEDMWSVENKLPYGADPKLFNAIRDRYGIDGMHLSRYASTFDGVIGAGLGSSGSAGVALIAAIKKLKGEALDRFKIANFAYQVEVNDLKWHGGIQDQLVSAYGGLNYMEIGKNMHLSTFDKLVAQEVVSYLTLFYIGGSRESRKLQKNIQHITDTQKYLLDRLKELALYARTLLMAGKYEHIGKLLHESWNLKRELHNKVTNQRIDGIYEYAREHGALGGKLLGAGGGGYMLFFTYPERRKNLVTKMREKNIEEVDFSVDYNGVEARIL